MKLPWHICVLIPARNEEELLPRCLASVLRARARLPVAVTCDIVVTVDASTDRTASIAQEMLSGYGVVVVTNAGIVGEARALSASTALERYRGPLTLCWFAHTDADCIVPEDWLVKQLLLAEQGIEAIAGIISVDTFLEHSAAVEHRFHRSYLIQPDGQHSHVHGANLGVRADAYQRAGGWSQLSTAEDHDLWNRLHRTGCSRVSTATLHVTTSGRRIGRAPHGFAEALAAHNEAPA
jgi:cellulose synthase/poly-beta-1,6-N-acetylglucosamine synthase-like glycosyltransferase